ncbi:hypothetical protein [Halorubrum sp. Atlit-26R]|uniref:hypothetical protein n=1 Tax=Halorubrum sp. Atlit-26R TaxID=2282128 RepID=UPI000EF17FAA|nr:hypothetical protein [Halorubrum sp. Atlit-26R]RLM62552.1 hypothetical protein DVK07_18575 [Halorubrum sp. Atlit-26R]
MSELGQDRWRRLLAQLDEPPVGAVAEALADARDLDVLDAYDAVEEALEEGVLVEDDTGGAFGTVHAAGKAEGSLDEAIETPEEDSLDAREAASSDDDPRGGDAQTAIDNSVATVDSETYPPTIAEREYWVNWILDGVGRKRPVAPWKTGHAYPVKWSGDLPEEERPETEFETAKRWADFDLGDADLRLPDDAQSESLGTGLLLPNERPERDECITLIDWDDVRDPDTEEIHPVAAEYINRFGGYVEVSTSGEGLHQFVLGGLRKRGKFIAPIDEEPFVGEDLPQVEIYDGGRHVAMTGRHVEGTDEDVLEDGQPLIDELVTEYADAEKGAGHRRYDPETGYVADGESGDSDGTADHVPEPKTGEYNGPSAEEIRETKPDDRSLAYHAVIETFYRGGGNSGGYAHIQNWRLEGFAAALGERDDLSPEEVKRDLGGRYLDDTGVTQRCVHRTPERVDYGHKRAADGRLEAPSLPTLVEYGVLPPTLVEDGETDGYDDDPRSVSATVDVRRAWAAAGRVEPSELDGERLQEADRDGGAFACPECGSAVDVVRAVAVAEGLVETCDAGLDHAYPEAYGLARTEYGAPLPEYLTTGDAIAEFDAVLDVIGEVGFFHLDEDALASEVTRAGEEVAGEAVRTLDPAWRESESGESVLVYESGTVWDADTQRVVDALRFVALDSGLLTDPRQALEGEDFTEAYRRARTKYGAPLPRWEPAADGARELTPQLPPSDELVDARSFDGVCPDELELAREEVEALIGEAATDTDEPTVVTALPATGKTTGTVKNARDRPLSYLAPRKELQAQALEKADRWGVDAEILPVLSEERVRPAVLDAAVSHVRERGKTRLRDRWAIFAAAFDDVEEEDADDVDTDEIFEDAEEGDGGDDLDRATCPTAEGDHGAAWALAVHVARRLGYTPREIHQQARGLFGAPLPCSDHEEGAEPCEYHEGWESVTDADAPPDLLVGSYIHAHVASVRTHFSRASDGTVDTAPRAVVLDEFPGEAFVSEFGENAEDFATWLAGCLRDHVDDRRDMLEADLSEDRWVRGWLDGDAAEADADVDDAITALGRTEELLDARENAVEILVEVDREPLEDLGLLEPLEAVTDRGTDAAEAYGRLLSAVGAVDAEQPGSGLAGWVDDAVREPLEVATAAGSGTPEIDDVDLADLPVASDLRALVKDAVDAARERRDGARAVLDAAVTALRGGAEGCRRLAAWADDGYAHPDAHHILGNIVEPEPTQISTSSWAFDPDATDGTVVDVADTGDRAVTVLDRNSHGARLHTPPARTDAGGEDVPLVGLDATGRASLWSVSLGEEVTTDDIHDTPRERARFLENALDLRVLQAADQPRAYSGDPSSKDTDGDVALLEAIAEEYAGIDAPRQRGEEAVEVGRPAAITTKAVREVLEGDARLDDVVAEWDHYGNVTGSNDLGAHRLAAVLGSQHYGDDAIERFCALAGEEVDTEREGAWGSELDYGSDLANTYLKHMREDQTTQAILRFARGDSGATVVARTSALRDDLPVVGRGQVVETWSDTAAKVAREYRRLGGEFTIADVADAVDVSRRQVRRVLVELTDAGYIRRVDGGDGLANVYEPAAEPGAGEVDLPDRDDAVAAQPGRSSLNQYYTWNVRVFGGEPAANKGHDSPPVRQRGAPPSPTAAEGAPGD